MVVPLRPPGYKRLYAGYRPRPVKLDSVAAEMKTKKGTAPERSAKGRIRSEGRKRGT
jgi:hypothetical protein